MKNKKLPKGKTPTEKDWIKQRKLAALAAAPGTLEEGIAAQKKLDRLEKRFDFTQTANDGEDIFRGDFQKASFARELCTFQQGETDISSFTKWAIENGTGIACRFRGDALCAEAVEASIPKLLNIVETIRNNFAVLWGHYANAPGTRTADRNNFLRGLYDGMMSDQKADGQKLPSVALPTKKKRRAARGAVSRPSGMSLHPYAALELGRKIRLCMPVERIAERFTQQIAA